MKDLFEGLLHTKDPVLIAALFSIVVAIIVVGIGFLIQRRNKRILNEFINQITKNLKDRQ
jgi:hypothetical protein